MLFAVSASGWPGEVWSQISMCSAALRWPLPTIRGGPPVTLMHCSNRGVRPSGPSRVRRLAASPEQLLAMKAFAARSRDAEDIRQLLRVLDLHTVDDVLASVRDIFPEEEPPERLRLLLEDIFSDEG